MKKKKNLHRIIVTSMIAVSLALGACAGKEDDTAQTAEKDQSLTVSVETPQTMTLSTQSRYIGTVEADNTVMVIAKVSAEVLSKNFEVGDHVNEGDLLFTMDDTLAQISLSQAQAALGSAQAGLSATQAAYAIQEAGVVVQEAQAEVTYANASETLGTMDTTEQKLRTALESAQAQLTQAALAAGTATDNYYYLDDQYNKANEKYKNDEPGYTKDTIEKMEVQVQAAYNQALSAAKSYETALAAVELSTQQLNDYLGYTVNTVSASVAAQLVGADQQLVISDSQLDAASANVKASRAAVSQAESALKNAETALDYYTVCSPVSGTVTAINVSEHNMATPSQAAYIIQSDTPGKVVFYVAEKTMNEMTVGNIATMDHDGVTFEGKVVSISDVIDTAQGLYRVEVQANDSSLLPPAGSSVNILTVSRQSKNALTVPANVIYYEEEQAYLYVQDGNKAKKVYVTTGLMEGDRVEIIEGLISSDPVIVSWNSNMKDGADIVVN